MWDFRCLFKALGSANFLPQNSQGFFASSSCCFSSSVRVPSLILCLRTCLFRPSPWMKPSPHWSHLTKFDYIQQSNYWQLTWRVFHQCASSHACPISVASQILVHKNCTGKVFRGRALELHERSTCQHLKNFGNTSATFWVKRKFDQFSLPCIGRGQCLHESSFHGSEFWFVVWIPVSYTLFNCHGIFAPVWGQARPPKTPNATSLKHHDRQNVTS